MKKILVVLSLSILLFNCNNKSRIPDVSGIKVNLEVRRFENDLFLIDTNEVSKELYPLQQTYPSFTPVFFGGVLGLPDSAAILEKEIRRFVSVNRFIYEAAKKKYKDVNDIKNGLERSFQFVKYYFPSYSIPKIITLIGPIDAMAKMENGDYSTDFLGPDFLGISLQFYLGANFSLYQAPYFIDNVAPLYRSRRFEKEYIVPDAMKLITDDLFPDKSNGRPLIEQMIEKGKQWWLLDKFLPGTPDSLKTGYTQKQIDWCRSNEGMIWNYFVTKENLETIEPDIIQNYIGESPTTQEMGGASPGNIGQWVGWQIVKKFADENSSLKPTEIMNTPSRKILTEAKYKPK
ncbi:MAG: hypothetical protein ACHQF0_14150 [Chitinophagales bacterium]